MGKRLPPKKRSVKRAKPPSKPKKYLSRTRAEAAKRGWETRKKREAQRVARADAAKRGWITRRTTALEEEGLHPRSAEDLGELSAERLQFLHNMRLAVLGPIGYSEELTGRSSPGLEVLRTMIQHRDKRWQTFTEFAHKAGFSSKQARTAFFSPSVKRMGKARAPGLRP